MDLYWLPQTSPGEQSLSQYKLSWIFFNSDEPDQRILMDNHKPIGLHVHVHNGPQIPVSATTIEEAQNVFVQMIKEHFDFDLEV